MKPLSDLDHYEVLEVEREAPIDEIERSYHVARSAYAEGSLATYSIFGERDAEALRHRIELAWRTLSDPGLRGDYDRQLSGDVPVIRESRELPNDPLLDALTRRLVDEEDPIPPRLPSIGRGAPADLVPYHDMEPEEGSSECDGARLRRARQKRGLELDQIATITKINSTYLRWIEEDALDQLPAPVYVRGFVKAFARCVGLDPQMASTSYMARFEIVAPKKRGRVFGRQPQI